MIVADDVRANPLTIASVDICPLGQKMAAAGSAMLSSTINIWI